MLPSSSEVVHISNILILADQCHVMATPARRSAISTAFRTTLQWKRRNTGKVLRDIHGRITNFYRFWFLFFPKSYQNSQFYNFHTYIRYWHLLCAKPQESSICTDLLTLHWYRPGNLFNSLFTENFSVCHSLLLSGATCCRAEPGDRRGRSVTSVTRTVMISVACLSPVPGICWTLSPATRTARGSSWPAPVLPPSGRTRGRDCSGSSENTTGGRHTRITPPRSTSTTPSQGRSGWWDRTSGNLMQVRYCGELGRPEKVSPWSTENSFTGIQIW